MSLYLISGLLRNRLMEQFEALPALVRGLSKKISFLKGIVPKKKKRKNWNIWNFTNEKTPPEGFGSSEKI